MSLRNRFFIFLGLLLIAAVLCVLLAPFAVREGVRAWFQWTARQENVQIEVGQITAPFLRKVTIEELRVSPSLKSGPAVQLTASGLIIDLNFRGWFFSRHSRFLQRVCIGRVSGTIRAGRKTHAPPLDWRDLQRLLPNEFQLAQVDLEVATRSSVFHFHDLTLSGSEIEAGKFSARQIVVTSPLFRKSFSDLRGSTAWENDRLTIAGISLVPGLDLESATLDLSGLTNKRVGLDFQLDAFGGTLRGSFQARAGRQKLAVDLAGSASAISLRQLSQAAGFLEPISGRVRASKFTFSGTPGQFLNATASVWIELRDFSWRSRHADSVVFGGTYYDRRFQVEQLYVRQGKNDLTVNGELLWPKKPVPWSALQFRGEINATIPDANTFAQLFGAPPGNFAGALSATGSIDSVDPAAQGRLSLRGKGLTFRGVALDSLGAEMQLRGAELDLQNLQVRHREDFLRAHGSVNLKSPHAYSARLTGALNNLADYAPLLPANWRGRPLAGGATFDWTGDGNFAANSGTMQLAAHGLQLPFATLRSPLDLVLEGTYSPQDVFFRKCRLANEHVSLGGFVMLGSNFIELQGLELLLDGIPRASGTLFLPVGVDRWWKSGSVWRAFDERQKFDVDVVVDQLDLAALARSSGSKSKTSGILDGKLAAYGPLASLQVTTDWHLRNLAPAPALNAIDFDLHYDSGRADANLAANFGVSSPVTASISLPLRLNKTQLATGNWIDNAASFSAAVNFPALYFQDLPEILRPVGATAGLLTGGITYGNSWRAPKIDGTMQLFQAKIEPPAPWPALSQLGADLSFGDRQATLRDLHFQMGGTELRWRGDLTTSPPAFTLHLIPEEQELTLPDMPANGADFSTVRFFGVGETAEAPRLREAIVRGKADSPFLSLTLDTDRGWRTFFHESSPARSAPLLLAPVPPSAKPAGLQLQ